MNAKTARASRVVSAVMTTLGLLGLGVLVVSKDHTAAAAPGANATVRPARSFDSIADKAARSRALFHEAGKVLQHPRCVNCHPSGDQPLQGSGEPHLPAVVRGEDGFGATALRCNTCHQSENYEPSGLPGHPSWHVAPLSMAWQGKTLGEICAQIKDPQRNGGMDMAKLHEHMAHDTLVGWGFQPGHNREPAPGTQARLGELIQAWIDTGAECPTP